jgi:hypothetical protein
MMVGGPGDADDEFAGRVPCSELPMCHGLNPSSESIALQLLAWLMRFIGFRRVSGVPETSRYFRK